MKGMLENLTLNMECQYAYNRIFYRWYGDVNDQYYSNKKTRSIKISNIITTFIIKTYIINSLRPKLLKACLRDFEAEKCNKADWNSNLISAYKNSNYELLIQL